MLAGNVSKDAHPHRRIPATCLGPGSLLPLPCPAQGLSCWAALRSPCRELTAASGHPQHTALF